MVRTVGLVGLTVVLCGTPVSAAGWEFEVQVFEWSGPAERPDQGRAAAGRGPAGPLQPAVASRHLYASDWQDPVGVEPQLTVTIPAEAGRPSRAAGRVGKTKWEVRITPEGTVGEKVRFVVKASMSRPGPLGGVELPDGWRGQTQLELEPGKPVMFMGSQVTPLDEGHAGQSEKGKSSFRAVTVKVKRQEPKSKPNE